MLRSTLFDIEAPLRSKYDIKQALFHAQNHKKIFEILTPKKLTEATRSIRFAQLLKQFDFALLQGNITHFFVWQNQKDSWIAGLYARFLVGLPTPIRLTFFCVLFVLKFIWNYLVLVATLLVQYKYSNRTQIATVDSRLVMFEVLKKAQSEGWSVLNINTDLESDNVTTAFIQHLYPELCFTVWDRSITAITQDHVVPVAAESFYSKHPMFWEIRRFVHEHPHDIIFIATRGSIQEYEFLQKLVGDDGVDFRLGSIYHVNDVSTQHSVSWSKKLSQFWTFFVAATLNQFLNSMDLHQCYHKKIVLTITNQSGETLYNTLGEKPMTDMHRSDTLQSALNRILKTISSNVIEFEPVNLDQKLESQIPATMRAFFSSGGAVSRDQCEQVTMRYVGDEDDVATPWVFI